jgi:hypothetical protein
MKFFADIPIAGLFYFTRVAEGDNYLADDGE